MRKRFLFSALAVAVLLTPVVLTIGVFVLIPLALVLVPVLLIAGIAALPALLVSAARDAEPAAHEQPIPAAHTQPPGTPVAFSR